MPGPGTIDGMTDIALRYHHYHHSYGHHGHLGTSGTIIVLVVLALILVGYGLYKYTQNNANR